MPPWIHILVMWTGNKKVHEGADGKTDETTQADAKDASFEIVRCRAPVSLSYFGQCTLPRWLLVCLPRSHPWGSSVFKAWGNQEHSVAKQEELLGVTVFICAADVVWKSQLGLFHWGAKLYEAYHIINHYNLFGGGYLYQGIGLLEGLLWPLTMTCQRS